MIRFARVAFPLMILVALIAVGCDQVNTQTTAHVFTRKWVAVGTDGSLSTGQCKTYDLRYCYDDSTLLNTKWDSCAQVSGLPAPKPGGTQETFTFSMTVKKDHDIYFALKVADSLNRWSSRSNAVKENIAANPPLAPALQ